ncbi:MAG: flagellar basal body P-ring protein FlgI [Spirochaetota bacterium]|nr:flagellar basal body P-ring protein FlgI [Spirochaetota bacterium]
MHFLRLSLVILFFFMLIGLAFSEIKVKLRDIAYIDGLRENQLFGFGLVVGLQGSGDTRSALIESSLNSILKNLGLEKGEDFGSKNVAAALLTAKLPPFIRGGDRVDITVSSIGDAKSLEGGILIQSPLRGADDMIYVVAQGALSLLSVNERGRSIKTVACIKNGGIVEREVEPNIVMNNSVSLILRNWDFSAAKEIIKSIQDLYPDSNPSISRLGRIKINIPKKIDFAEFISSIENIEITPFHSARVVVNERDGTIVMGEDVKISEVLVSKDGITISTERSDRKSNVAILKETSTVKDLMDSLNYIGASTRDIISILNALKDAGALHAELVIK